MKNKKRQILLGVGFMVVSFLQAQDLKLNDKDYFERQGVNVLVFSNSFNGGFNDTIPERPRRRKFFEATASGADFQTALDRALRVPPYKTALKKLTTTVRKTLSRIVK